MPNIENLLSNLSKDNDLFSTENLLMEAIEDMIKEEIKNHIRAKLEEDEELKKDFKNSVEMLMEAKVKEGYAYAMLAKSSADLGLELIPPDLKEEMKSELAKMLEEKMEEMMG